MTKNERGTARRAGAMRSCRLCALASMLVVAVVPARLARGLTAQDPPLVRLALVDLYGLTPDVAAQAAAEAGAVLDRLGARTEVRWEAPTDVHDPRDLLVVVMPGDPGPLLKRTVMGAVLQDAPTRALWVFPRTIAAALGLSPEAAASRTPEERAVFVRALGRVVAHEVVHLTCPWRDHDRTGLMAARMSRATLRGEALDLEDDLRRDFVLGASAQASRSLPVALGRQPAKGAPVSVSDATSASVQQLPATPHSYCISLDIPRTFRGLSDACESPCLCNGRRSPSRPCESPEAGA